ncbi:MAG: hypothetical protein JO286_26580 [Solirubrobacterales bacterium]|nr:hypothetical protein [Solirubrobacterales bacterium]MBV9810769.1 hypothetical protein [Solirubrobacterales bacterium]
MLRASAGRSWLVKSTLVFAVAVTVGAIIVVFGGRHPGLTSTPPAASSLSSGPHAGNPGSRPMAAQTASGARAEQRRGCVVTITKATVCGASAAQYCNLVISRALPQGRAATSRCVSQIRQFNRERARAYELNEESSEPVQGGGEHS